MREILPSRRVNMSLPKVMSPEWIPYGTPVRPVKKDVTLKRCIRKVLGWL